MAVTEQCLRDFYQWPKNGFRISVVTNVFIVIAEEIGLFASNR